VPYTEAELRVQVGIRLVLSDTSWPLGQAGIFLEELDDAWVAAKRLADVARPGGAPDAPTQLKHGSRSPSPQLLVVDQLILASPLDLTLALQGGLTGAAIYSLHLLARIARKPDDVGRWLPRLVRGWHEEWAEADEARALRRQRSVEVRADRVQVAAKRLDTALDQVQGRPQDAEVIGSGSEPEEITRAVASPSEG
jgi:hypothetical protein